MGVVLDASCMVAVILDEVIPDDVARLSDTLAQDGATVPALWHWEVVNSLLTASRRTQRE